MQSTLPLTREDAYRIRKSDKMFISRSVMTSKAFLSLSPPTACQVYLIFLTKCRWEPAQGGKGRKNKVYIHTNNGEIQFTYKEAKEKFGISSGRFTRAIDELVQVGLIDIAHTGFGLHKDVTLYAISDRWRYYGTDEFIPASRAKRPGLGFRKGNTLGVNSRKQHKQ